MFNIDEEKDKLTKKLSEQYSQNIINMDEYERLLDYINKIETGKEISVIEKIINENNVEYGVLTKTESNAITASKEGGKYVTMFSWRTSNVKSVNGNGGEYICFFGTNRIIADNLPKGRTIINVSSVFGLTEIIVSKNIKIINKTTPIFSGIFAHGEMNKEDEDLPELYIAGQSVFGNITIRMIEEVEKENEFGEKLKEKILNIIDRI
ncbi:MAG: hypothetical protein LBD58_13550 [Treponema sp.]|jgi:hypothetical protein|nr:hypothetical protein [Treponema sp.]